MEKVFIHYTESYAQKREQKGHNFELSSLTHIYKTNIVTLFYGRIEPAQYHTGVESKEWPKMYSGMKKYDLQKARKGNLHVYILLRYISLKMVSL